MNTRERLQMIREDCKADAAHYDGEPFTGTTIGTILGQHLAMLDALAVCMLEQEDRLDGQA